MSSIVEILLIVLMVLANGLFAMSEIAVVSSRKARLQQRAEHGDDGARAALELIESPNRFLSAVQIGITLVGILAGAFGGATIAQEVAIWLSGMPFIGQYGEALGVTVVVLGITYLSLVLGELVPKRLGLNDAENVASRVARPMQLLALSMTPAVRLLTISTDIVMRLIGAKPSTEPPITEQEIEILIEQGIQAGVFEQDEHDIVERVLDLDTRRAKAVMTPRTEIVYCVAGYRGSTRRELAENVYEWSLVFSRIQGQRGSGSWHCLGQICVGVDASRQRRRSPAITPARHLCPRKRPGSSTAQAN